MKEKIILDKNLKNDSSKKTEHVKKSGSFFLSLSLFFLMSEINEELAKSGDCISFKDFLKNYFLL